MCYEVANNIILITVTTGIVLHGDINLQELLLYILSSLTTNAVLLFICFHSTYRVTLLNSSLTFEIVFISLFLNRIILSLLYSI